MSMRTFRFRFFKWSSAESLFGFRSKELTLFAAAFFDGYGGHESAFEAVGFAGIGLSTLPCHIKVGTFSAVDSLFVHEADFIINRYN